MAANDTKMEESVPPIAAIKLLQLMITEITHNSRKRTAHNTRKNLICSQTVSLILSPHHLLRGPLVNHLHRKTMIKTTTSIPTRSHTRDKIRPNSAVVIAPKLAITPITIAAVIPQRRIFSQGQSLMLARGLLWAPLPVGSNAAS